ncbi:MAG: UDP-N-acetylmuramoyl-L-alanine--D-glutamate ligase [Epsilonproteobacteria bacterium]|nr:UDP-N-acetylmuramoyl-L-alanine--D-glutamate ligase [Campylobacterota bacterium]
MIALFGHGKTTKAIAKKLKNCQIFDDCFSEKSLDEFGNELLPPSLFDPNNSDMQIPSPSFPLNHPLMKKANNLISEYDFFQKDMPYSIWISGTNGKTTTTQMLDFIFKKRGSECGGNIGNPLANLNKNANIWLLETSSYMLFHTKIATPNLYLLLPIKPDHLSWHGSFEEYEKAKLSPLYRMSEGDIAIIPDIYKNIKTMAHVIAYKDENDLAKKMDIDIKKVNFQAPFLLDALLALACEKILLGNIDYKKFNTFKTDAHKLEVFKDKLGRVWVNDSKGTNLDATIEAIKRYKNEDLILILGGDDKGVDLAPLFIMLKPLRVKVFAIGSNTDKIVNFCNGINKTVKASYHLEIAMEEIQRIHTKNSVVLLSPAASSLDQFNSYVTRGNIFKKLALK